MQQRIIVDTENYSGNFERDMIAYATGCGDVDTGYDAEGAKIRASMRHHDWWALNIVPQKDPSHKGYYLTAQIWPTPDWVSNGMGKRYHVSSPKAQKLTYKSPSYQSVMVVVQDPPPSDVWEEFQERVLDFCENHPRGKDVVVTGARQEAVRPKMTMR